MGLRFGKWTTISNPFVKRKKNYIKSRCDCGRSSEVQTRALMNGRSTQCSKCSVVAGRKVAVGQKYCKWEVIDTPSENTNRKWPCRCICGAITNHSASVLINGRSKGCRRCVGHGAGRGPHQTLWTHILDCAKRRDIPVTLHMEEAFELLKQQNEKCALSGIPIVLGRTAREASSPLRTASLDRIDSLKGYEHGNVQWVHKTVNKMKQDLPQEEFVHFCRSIANHLADTK